MDECAAQQFKEFDGKKLKSTPKEGFDLGDEDEKNKLEVLKAEFESLTKLMRDVLGDKVEKMIVSHRIIDSQCVYHDVRVGVDDFHHDGVEDLRLRRVCVTNGIVRDCTSFAFFAHFWSMLS